MYYPNTKMEIYTYTELPETDNYGNPRMGYIYRETIPVDFQPLTRQDKLTSAGEILQDTYRIYIPAETQINTNDIFKDMDGDTYTIIGTPILNNRFKITQHKKIELQKTNKPIKITLDDYS